MALKNTKASIGKQSAEPIDANFSKVSVSLLGSLALVDRHAKTISERIGATLSIDRTRF
jgi:hypothetical protein